MDKPRGALVAGVDKASPAVKANIRTGDVIIRFDGQDVASMRDLPRMAAETPIGKTVSVVVWREGKEKQVEITVSEMKETSYAGALPNTAPVETVTIRDIPLLGIGVAEITPDLRRKYHLSKNAAGLVVVSVSSKSDAAQKGLKSGDLVVELDKKSVTGFKTLELWEKDAAEMGQESAFVLIERNGERFFAVVRFAPAS